LGFVAGKNVKNTVIFEMKIAKKYEKLQFSTNFLHLKGWRRWRKLEFPCYNWEKYIIPQVMLSEKWKKRT
jgi:hypothetical protein